MGRPRKNRPVENEETGSLNNNSEEPITSDQAPLPEQTVNDSFQPSLDASPFLMDDRIVRDYTESNTATGGNPQQQPFQQPQPQVQQPAQSSFDETLKYTIAPDPNNVFKPVDAPEQQFMPPPDPFATNTFGQPSVNGQPQQMDKGEAQKYHDTADLILKYYVQFVPMGGDMYTKMNETQIRKLVDTGDLFESAYQSVQQKNKENKEKLTEKAKEDAKLLRDPLRRLAQEKQLAMPPHVQLVVTLIIVIVGQIVLIREIKKSNDAFHKELLAQVSRPRPASFEQPVQPEQPAKPNIEDAEVITTTPVEQI